MAYLAGASDGEAGVLRARALARLGDFAQSAQLLAVLGDDEAALDMNWQNQDWQEVASNGTGERQRAAELAVDDDPVEASGPIARNQALLSRSSETRSALNALLTAVERP
ncbi:hypothetical protein AIOL_004012 [Candidatus Rhodobacter oscarellae]|uniref:Uncharacterized protein n=1 Tax=Candidatus Rhodobacter oscarellae TaxID=1675527 RepID=A0A0J9E8N2_9RHOB|nr:hypothetical protein [Candidatus Rhodobacter lobularis]KMW59031.1 hypothetical protein AIOL_004012 [Candidatus Rhodobacter lobularis]